MAIDAKLVAELTEVGRIVGRDLIGEFLAAVADGTALDTAWLGAALERGDGAAAAHAARGLAANFGLVESAAALGALCASGMSNSESLERLAVARRLIVQETRELAAMHARSLPARASVG